MSLSLLLLITGFAIIGFDIIANSIGVGINPGIGPAQILVAVIGLFVCLVALSLRSKNKRHSNIAVFFVSFMYLATGFYMAPKTTPNVKGPQPFDERPGDLHYHHDLQKNAQYISSWAGLKYVITTNSLGFKDNSKRMVELNNDKNRILIIGDSFTEGMGYKYDLTFAGIFSSRLDREKYEVLNAGVGSYSPKLYYLKVKYLIERKHLRFNELFVFIDISDIQDEIIYEKFKPATLLYEWKLKIMQTIPQLSKIESSIKKTPDSKMMAYNDPFWEGVYGKTRALWTTDENIYKKWGERGLFLAAENMDLLYRLCKKHNIKMTIAVYPWPHQIRKHDLDSIQVKFWRAFAKERSVDFINFFPYFINDQKAEDVISRYYLPNDEHWNGAGHRIIAGALYEYYFKNINSSKN